MEELYGFVETEKDSVFEKRLRDGRLVFKRLIRARELGPYLDLLNEIWGFSDPDKIPLHEAVVTVKTGGLFLGVDLDDDPAGLVYVMPAFTREWGYHHHSNFMGYKREYRSLGIGLEAKRVHAALAQREGVGLVTWTFDPLQQANANFNFRKLGAECSNYLEDLYGGMGGNFDPGLPTDRFLIKWRLGSARVAERLGGEIPTEEDILRRYGQSPLARLAGQGLELEDGSAMEKAAVLLAAIPSGLDKRAATDPAGAREELARFGGLMKRAFKMGFVVTEMIRAGQRDDGAYYVLERRADA